ncbi:hypothetical protein PaG_00945 [Moesziomyces aphidis]|uniref:Uncharacterized protein n=1 Tax=Moesziomyces aphidis TaxID=84754 RepID=W3VS73_MOEAP|nr:hypothetical protein PaG_00945 [Moesziomyces aphidis]
MLGGQVGNIPAGDYACFRLNGDIRTRLQTANDSTKGFVNNAGSMFVVVLNRATQVVELHTDKTGVWVSHPDGSLRDIQLSLRQLAAASAGDENGQSDHQYACNGHGPIALAD